MPLRLALRVGHTVRGASPLGEVSHRVGSVSASGDVRIREG